MELINQVTSMQFVFPALAVAGFIIGTVLVFVFGFKSGVEPQFDKLPLVIDDRKNSNKKRKTKEKKSGQEGEKSTKKNDAKKSPAKEKKEQKQEVQKPKEKVQEVKKTPTKKEATVKKTKLEKPVDFDDGEWEKVPSKNDKKKKNQEETKKDSPVKDKKKAKKDEIEVETKKITNVTPSAPVKENLAVIDKDLQEKIMDLQRALNAMEERERASTPVKTSPVTSDSSNKKVTEEIPAKKEGGKKDKKVEDFVPPPAPAEGGAVFDELGDTWTDAKAPKKNKKKVRKEQ